MAPKLARASTSLARRYPISLGLSSKSNPAERCEIDPSPFALRHDGVTTVAEAQ
jgi:hypothetical protein